MDNYIKKVILVLVLLAVLVAAGLFLFGKKSASFQFSSEVKSGTSSDVEVPKQIKGSVKILFVGDIMFDRYIRQVADRRGTDFLFQKVDALLGDNDLVVGNLEGPITKSESKSINSAIGSKENYIFTFDPKFAGVLEKENIKLVNIGNNHILNFGSDGVESTREYLIDSEVGYFGDPENENGRVKIENINGVKIAFVNCNQFVADAKQKTLSDIEKAKTQKVDLIILYTHWGTEFAVGEPSDKIKNLAHEFIDAGVDLIIGSHPHVVQAREEYEGKMIYYSLGNFIFDQYFSSETQKGLAVQVEINTDKKMQFQEFFVKMSSSGQTSLQ